MQVRNRQIYEFDEFQLHADERLLLRRGEPVALHGKAFEMLLVLIRHRGRLLTKEELFDLVWPDQIVEESNLTVNMSAIRKALGERASAPRYIKTVSGHGYRFMGDVREILDKDEELLFERETVTRIVVEQEEVTSDVDVEKPFLPKAFTPLALKQGDEKVAPRTRAILFLTLLGALVLIAAATAYQLWRAKRPRTPFQQIQLSRLTNSGKVAGACIAPDGKYIAFVLSESEGNSLWVQQVGTASRVRVLPPTKSHYWGITFSPDGEYIYYNLFAGDKTDVELFRVPSLGGVSQQIPNIVTSSITFAPDGKQFAYTTPQSTGEIALMVSDIEGSQQRVLAKAQHPNRFEYQGQACSWSPDEETIACFVNNFETDASYSSIVGISVSDGRLQPLSAQRWHNVSGIRWLGDGDGLIVAASSNPSAAPQIWFISYPEGDARQLTKDLGGYSWLGAASDGQSIAAMQANTVNSLSVGAADGRADGFKEIAREVGPLSPFAWMPDGRLVFRSTASGESDLWMMEADGTGRKQLTVGAQVDSKGLCVSSDGASIVFVSRRGGRSNLWRVATNGDNPVQLTNGEDEAFPYCSPDGQRVVFQKGLDKLTLWEVSIAGGEPVQLSKQRAKWVALSRDGGRAAFFYINDDKWRIGIIPSKGGQFLQSVEVPASLQERVIHWSVDGRALYYIHTIGDVGNVWTLPLDGSQPQPFTDFAANYLDDFAWSPDGERLAVVRSAEIRDVVLLRSLSQ